MAQLSEAVAKMESGGNYRAIGPQTGHGRAIGKYQIMEANIPSWTKQVLGKAMTAAQFYHNNEAQDLVARAKMQEFYDKTGNHADVVSMWHSGRTYKGNTRKDVNMSTKDYTNKIAAIYNKMVQK